ncbi:MAG: ribosome biogenesis GTP-binding protein YihA/YsxC [bacterium]|nr:ribosome biogenesis GTP-binding protein YihA/YsxC [bacterium]
MKISSAEFLRSTVSAAQYPRQPLPEVAFAGRSNVGKSSLINTLLHRKGFAKISNTPGKTQAINFFLINQRFLLVDLPGYGYAKVPRTIQAGWQPMVETYLQQREMLQALVHIVDIRHPPTVQDQQLRQWLVRQGLAIVTVATKADKIKRSQRSAHIQEIRRVLAIPVGESLLLFSSHNREGRHKLWHHLEGFLASARRLHNEPSP